MPLIGIDLGTTNSLVCAWQEEQATIIPNGLGKHLTPSIISYDEKNDDIVIGQAAKERLVSHPSLTIPCFKRAMGSNTKYKLGKKIFSPVELSALVLKQLKGDAEAFLGEPVTEAIISVPAYFNDAQRQATKMAGELAGLKVERLINEPTAAALAYGAHEKSEELLFMVIDLGGGTLDVSILDIFDNVIEVRASAGDNYLGGEDFAATLQEQFIANNNINVNKLAAAERSRIAAKVDELKHALSASEEAVLDITLQGTEYHWTTTKQDFEKACQPLIKRFLQPIERALRDSKLQLDELDNIVLVGGATRMPWIRSEVAKLFRRLPASNINPDEVVVMGAAIQAALKDRNAAFEDVVLTDVCPYTLGVEVSVSVGRNNSESGHFLPIIERNSTVPVSREKTLVTLTDNQTQVVCNIFQGESRLTKNNIQLGTIDTQVPAGKAGEQSVTLRFTYDINGILEALVTSTETGETKRAIINNSAANLTTEQIEESFEKLASLKIHPRENAENRQLIARLERLYEERLGDERDYISHLLVEFESSLHTQEHKEIDDSRERIEDIINMIEQR